MSDNQEKTKSDVGLTTAFRAGMGAAQSMHQTAIEIPLKILQEFGVAEDKMEGLREKSRELIGGLYHMIDDAAVKTGFVQAREGEEGERRPPRAEPGLVNQSKGWRATTEKTGAQCSRFLFALTQCVAGAPVRFAAGGQPDRLSSLVCQQRRVSRFPCSNSPAGQRDSRDDVEDSRQTTPGRNSRFPRDRGGFGPGVA